MQVKSTPLSQPILFTKTLLVSSCLPLLVGLTCDTILSLVEETNPSFLTDQNPQRLQVQENLLISLMKQAKETSYGVYDSFIKFMAAMMILHLVIQILKYINQDVTLLPSEDKTSFEIKTSRFKKMRIVALQILGYILAYCTIYYLYSRIGVPSSLNSLEQHFKLDKALPRILEEEISQNNDQSLKAQGRSNNSKNPTTFPLGTVLGSLNIDASSIVFSKDESTIFATSKSFFGVTAVNISDWENPSVIREFQLRHEEKLQKVSLLLSPDGKALFVSNMNYFAKYVVDNSNSLQAIPDRSLDPALPKNLNISFQTSLAFSPDGTKIFAAGYGLQIFNTSVNTRNLNKIRYELTPGEVNLSTTAVSFDGKSLFLLNGTILKTYNITDLDNMNLISSFESENMLPYSFIQSQDGKILTLIGFERGTTTKVIIERVDVSNVTAPSLIKTIPLNIESFSSLFGLEESPKETFLFFTIKEKNDSETKMMVFDTFTEKLLEDSQKLISRAKSLLFTSDESKVVAVFDESITTILLFQNYPNDRIFSISKEILAEVLTTSKSKNKMLKEFSSSNGRFLLSVDELSNSAGSNFTFTDISNRSSPKEIPSFSTGDTVSASITNDGKRLSVSFQSKIIVCGISNMTSPNVLGSYPFEEPNKILHAVFTSDGKTCFTMMSNGTASILKVFDLSDLESIKEIDSFSNEDFTSDFIKPTLLLSKDEKSLLVNDVNGTFIGFFDVSAREVARGKNNFWFFNSPASMSQSISLSPDGRILIIKREDLHSSSLIIWNVTDPFDHEELKTFPLPKTKTLRSIPVRFSPDGKIAYVEGTHGGHASLWVLNISNPYDIIFQSVIQAEVGSVDNFIISDDGQIAYVASNVENKILVMNLNVSYTAYLRTESFRLGEKSSTDIMVLRQNGNGDYAPMKEFRFAKASLFSTKIVSTESSTESKFTPLPNWMTFQKETGTFTIEPKKQSDLKSYTLCTAFSTQVGWFPFHMIPYYKKSDDYLKDLLLNLKISGYLDSDNYVTGKFGSLENFSFNGGAKKDVYQVLKENYFETFTVFDVVSSLDLITVGKKLEIETASENSLKIEMTLMNPSIQFLNKQYGALVPLITENKTKLAIEGSVDDVNSALKKLVVNSALENQSCEGTITFWDHLNPSISKNLKNLSTYFEINEVPMANEFTFQEQINSKSYYTGKEFFLSFSKNTFIDKHTNTENLRFAVTLDNKERSSVSDWLTINDGILRGTPKKELFNRRKNLLLTVKNEFKQIEVPFTLEVELSLGYLLELLMKYSPHILTVVSIWILANRIYNILKKSKYRHYKDFYISVGQEITAQEIYPIIFLGQEHEESDLIWKHLRKEGLDKSNMTIEIKKVVDKLPEKDLVLSKKGSHLSQKLIHQFLKNRLAFWLIDSKEEKETKRVYEKEIESRLMDFVIWDFNGYCQINELEFKNILNGPEKEEGLETELISQNVINKDLLKDLVIAKAMQAQSIPKNAVLTQVVVQQEFPGNWIKRFLKLDLYQIHPTHTGQNTVYGINYELKNGVLRFSGVAEEMFCQKTIVIQIMDLRHKILKEVWIHGVNPDNGRGNLNYSEIL